MRIAEFEKEAGNRSRENLGAFARAAEWILQFPSGATTGSSGTRNEFTRQSGSARCHG
jgi:hypothetical protein